LSVLYLRLWPIGLLTAANIMYSAFSIIRGNVEEWCARITEKHVYNPKHSSLSHEQKTDIN